MSNPDDLTKEELEEQDPELLPEREAMSVITPIDHSIPPDLGIDPGGWGEPAPPPTAE